MEKLIFILVLMSSGLLMAQPSKEEQFKISLKIMTDNATKSDVYPGFVVASPSKQDPNYYYDWVRDTSLTMSAFIDYFEFSKDESVKKLIFNWIEAEIYRQKLPTLSGLGEPKYNVDGSDFSGPWGRPQNDGPALRALAMIKFARLLLKNGEQDYVLKKLYHGILPASSVIKIDLEYTAYNWKSPSFDLWEEEKGMHFYTLMAQHTALQEGGKLAYELGDKGAADFYEENSILIGKKIKAEFLDNKVGIIVTKNKDSGLWYKNSGLDVAPLLALLHNSPYQKLFSLNDIAVKKYIQALISSFSDIYTINKTYSDLGVAIGRYPEDRYDGYNTESVGHAWFLATLALGEYYCLQAKENKSSKNNEAIERQFARVLFHSDRKGHLSEQFNRETGFMQGARDLTWSHNAFITSMLRCDFIR